MTLGDKFSQEEQAQSTYENVATARRVTLTDATGGNISNANPLPVDIQTAGSKTPAIEFQTVTGVTINTQTTVLTFTNSTGGDLFIDAVGGTGTARSEWVVLINTVEVFRRRMGVANMNLDVRMFDFKLANTDVIDIKITHFETATQSFQAELRYYS